MNEKIVFEELSFFAQSLSLLIIEKNNNLNEQVSNTIKKSFNSTKIVDYKESNTELIDGKFNIVLLVADFLDDDTFEVLKELKLNNKEIHLIVILKTMTKKIQRLFEIKTYSVLLEEYTDYDILQKLILETENCILKDKYTNLRNDMYIYNLKKSLNEASKNIKEIEKQKLIDNKSVDEFVDNLNQDHIIDDSMWEHISDEIQTLNEIYEENINKIVLSGFDEHTKAELTDVFSRYNSSLQLIPGLEEFSEIFADLSNSLTNLQLEKLDKNSIAVFDMFEYLYEDITKFFDIVMIERKTKNLNYLTDSMKSSITQIKMSLGLVEIEEDELELF